MKTTWTPSCDGTVTAKDLIVGGVQSDLRNLSATQPSTSPTDMRLHLQYSYTGPRINEASGMLAGRTIAAAVRLGERFG
jgi:hypothetical protein